MGFLDDLFGGYSGGNAPGDAGMLVDAAGNRRDPNFDRRSLQSQITAAFDAGDIDLRTKDELIAKSQNLRIGLGSAGFEREIQSQRAVLRDAREGKGIFGVRKEAGKRQELKQDQPGRSQTVLTSGQGGSPISGR